MVPSYKPGMSFTELIGEKGISPSVDCWQDTGSQAAMLYDLNADSYLADGPGKILGYSSASAGLNAAGVRTLNRILPLRHPRYRWMCATRIQSVQPIKFTGQDQEEGDLFAVFSRYRLPLIFSSLPYTVLSDADLLAISSPAGIPDESLRYVEKLGETMSETLTVQQGSLVYKEGPFAAPPAKTVPNQRYQIVSKRVLTWTWRKVAHKYLMKDGTDIPSNLDLVVNKTNNAVWNGYPPGTLLFKSHKETPVEAPTDPASMGLPANGPPRMWDVTLIFVFFDPPTDPILNNPTRGHSLVPAPQLSTPYWYLAGDALNGNPLYQSGDFTKIFRSPN